MAPQIRAEFDNLGRTVPAPILGRLRLACADLILSKLHNVDLASQSCYLPLMHALNHTTTDPSPSSHHHDMARIQCQAVLAHASGRIQSLLGHDPGLNFTDTIEQIRDILQMVQTEIGTLTASADQSVSWEWRPLLFQTARLFYVTCLELVKAGRGPDALSLLNWAILLAERALDLRSAPVCALYLNLYDQIITISLEMGNDTMANAALDRATNKIQEIHAGGNPDVKSDTYDIAEKCISQYRQRIKYATGSNINLDDALPRSTSIDRLAAYISLVTLPANVSRPYYEAIIKSLQSAPNIIRSIMAPGAARLQFTESGIPAHIRTLLQITLQWKQFGVGAQIADLCPDLTDPVEMQSVPSDIRVLLYIVRLGTLSTQLNLQAAATPEYCSKVQHYVSCLLADPAAWIPIYCPLLESILTTMQPLIQQTQQQLQEINLDLLLQIADLWLRVSVYDPTAVIRYVLELARGLSPTTSLCDMLQRSLQSLTDYRSRMAEHNRDTCPDYVSSLHTRLLMTFYRIHIMLHSVSMSMKMLEIGQDADIRSQAIFWLQAASCTRSNEQAEKRLARAEALLRQADHDKPDHEDDGDGISPGSAAVRLCPLWVGTTRVALQIPRKAWRIYGKRVDTGVPTSGLGLDIGINDVEYLGLGIDIEHGHHTGPYIVSGLDPNQRYVFAYKTSSTSGMSPVSHPISTCLVLPTSLIWAYLSHIAYQLRYPTLAHRAARRAVRSIQYSEDGASPDISPGQYGEMRHLPILDRVALSGAPITLVEADVVCYHILSDTLQLPKSLSRASIHIRSLDDSEWFLLRRAHWLQLAVVAAVSIPNPQLVYDSALRLYTCLTPVLDHSVVTVFLRLCLQALLHIDKAAAWPKPIAIVALRMAAVLVRMSDNLDAASSPLLTRSDVEQLLTVTDCAELSAFRALLSRSSMALFRDISGLVPILSLVDINNVTTDKIKDINLDRRYGICLQALHHGFYDRALQLLDTDPAQASMSTGTTTSSATTSASPTSTPIPATSTSLSKFIQCVRIWRQSVNEIKRTSISDLGWYWHTYRYLHLQDLTAVVPAPASAVAVTSGTLSVQFWSDLQSAIQIAVNAQHWHLVHVTLRLIWNVVWGSTSPSSDSLTSLHGHLTTIATLCLDMIEMIRDTGWGQGQHRQAPPPPQHASDVVQAPALDLAWGLRYSAGHDLVAQPEWRTSLWFMAVAGLDLDLVYGAVLAPALWIQFRCRRWSDLVRLGHRWDTLTQSNWARSYLHYMRFAQRQLVDEAQGRHHADLRCLLELDQEMETMRADSARRRAQKRSRQSKQEEDDRLSAAVTQYEQKRHELVQRESQSSSELEHEEKILSNMDLLHDDIYRDYPLSARKFDLARQAHIQARDHPDSKSIEVVLTAYQKAIKTARAKQETILLSRSLLDLGDVQEYFQLYDEAGQTWSDLIDSLSVRSLSDIADRQQLLDRIGFWNCIYGAVAQYRSSRGVNDADVRRNSARVCSALAWAVLAMSRRHPSERVHLVRTYQRPGPVVPALDLAQQSDRIRYTDLIDTFMFAARHALDEDRPLDALAPLVIVLDAGRADPQVTIQALSLKVEVCLSLGQISEAVALICRLIRNENIPWTCPSISPTDISVPKWSDHASLADNQSCMDYITSVQLPPNIVDCIRHAYASLIMYFISCGRYQYVDLAKKLLQGFPIDLAQLHLERGSINDCIQQCDDILQGRAGITITRLQRARIYTIQLHAMQLGPIHTPPDTISQVAATLEQLATDLHDQRLQRRAQTAQIEADLVRGVVLDRILDRYRAVIDAYQPEDRVLPESIDVVLVYVTLLLQRQGPHDVLEAIQRLNTLLDVYLNEARAHGCMISSSMNRYLPCLRPLIHIYMILSYAYEINMDIEHARTASDQAAQYLSILPYSDTPLEVKVLYRQMVCGSGTTTTDLALSCINQIITGCGHSPRQLRRAVLALSKQLTDPNMIAQCLAVAANVTNCARRLQRNMFEIGATASPIDKLDAIIQRDLRDIGTAFAVQARLQLLPASEATVTPALVEAVRKELPKITTLDIIQLLIALRNDEEHAWRYNPHRHRYIQCLHGYLRDNVPLYRNTCCIPRLELDTLRAPISATVLIMAWEPSRISSQVQVRFVAGAKVGVARAQGPVLARIYHQAGSCRLTLAAAERRTQSAQVGGFTACTAHTVLTYHIQIFAEIMSLIRDAFRDPGPEPSSRPDSVPADSTIEMSVEMAADLQRLFDIDGVQMVDSNAVLARALTPILHGSASVLLT